MMTFKKKKPIRDVSRKYKQLKINDFVLFHVCYLKKKKKKSKIYR